MLKQRERERLTDLIVTVFFLIIFDGEELIAMTIFESLYGVWVQFVDGCEFYGFEENIGLSEVVEFVD